MDTGACKYILWRKSRPKILLPQLDGAITYEHDSIASLATALFLGRHSLDDVLVLCDKRHQVVLMLLRLIGEDRMPLRIFIVTPHPEDKWLGSRIPDYLRDRVFLTTDPENVSYP